jgi:acyl-[acyl-carrier-protein] desaturase
MNVLHPHHKESLMAIEGVLVRITATHIANHKDWFPSELIPKEHNVKELSPTIKAMLGLNLLTEDGLPHFFGLLVTHLGDSGPWLEWIQRWVSEEDRHGTSIKHYNRAALTNEQMVALEKMQFAYLQDGFWPNWSGNPFRLIAYVVIQEQATQLSHATIAQMARSEDRVLTTLMSKIAGEEHKHAVAYHAMFKALMEIDPSEAVAAFAASARNFGMPGATITGFAELSKLQERVGAFGAAQLHRLLVTTTDQLGINKLPSLNETGERARDELNETIMTIGRVAERRSNQKPITIPINFLGSNVSVTC